MGPQFERGMDVQFDGDVHVSSRIECFQGSKRYNMRISITVSSK